MSIFDHVGRILKHYCPPPAPVVLALSGGTDSLCLFYCLLHHRAHYDLPFHVAHLDHGWRPESGEERELLQQLADQYAVPFHCDRLSSPCSSTNLEATAREWRYRFLSKISRQIGAQAILTAHHRDDQAETVLKRLLEGAHWSRWHGLLPERYLYGCRIVRPFLALSKQQLIACLKTWNATPLDDVTNRDSRFLRARIRHELLPFLNRTFGKRVETSLVEIATESHDWVAYLESQLAYVLTQRVNGMMGDYVEIPCGRQLHVLEARYLIRRLCEDHHFSPSREIIARAARALERGEAHRLFRMGRQEIWVDRHRLFIPLPSLRTGCEERCGALELGEQQIGNWRVNVTLEEGDSFTASSWQEAWQGSLTTYLPEGGRYLIGGLSAFAGNAKEMRQWWSRAKVPPFLLTHVPVIWQEGEERRLIGEFLSGRQLLRVSQSQRKWKVQCILEKQRTAVENVPSF